jgi:hypothetical protein
LNARANNWRQKARISAKGLGSARLPVLWERDSEVIVVMTVPAFFVRRLQSRGALFWALAGSFGPESLKEGFIC